MWKSYVYSQSYRLGIKRKWWFGHKVYRVVDHRHETYIMRDKLKNVLNIKPKLSLYLEDGTQISIPDIESKQWKLYPEYRLLEANKAVDTFAKKTQPSAPFEPRKVDEEVKPEDLPRTLQ